MTGKRTKGPSLEFWRNVLANMFRLSFEPEIKRRQADGRLGKPANIWGAQVILEPGKPATICLNDEVKGIFAVRFKDPDYAPTKGALSDLSKIESIEEVVLTDAYPNAGHFTVIFTDPFPFISFDFRYNATRIDVLLARADEFHSAAKSALRRQHYSSFAENLFAEVELLAKAVLAHHPDERLLKGVTHSFIKSEINRYTKAGNIPSRFVELHNKLGKLRSSARYGEKKFVIDQTEASRMLRVARDLFRFVNTGRPRRWKDSDPT